MQGDVGLSLEQRTELYLPMLAKMGQAYAIPVEWLVAFARVESAFRANAINNSSGDLARGGSRGLCQMSLQTARSIGFTGKAEDLFDPLVNAKWAAVLIALNMKSFRVTELRDVAALYNSGKRFDKAPASTRILYVPAIIKYSALYKTRAEAAAAKPNAIASAKP